MRSHLLLASSLLLAGLASAQTNTEFHIYPQPNAAGTNTSTSAAWYYSTTLRNEVIQECPNDLFGGIGDNNTNCQFTQFRFVTQDEDAATQETYAVVLRRPLTAAPGPDVTTAGEIARTAPVQTPAGTGRAAWMITLTFTTPVTIPCEGGFFYGVEIGAFNTTLPDGQTIHGAHYTMQALGDNPRFGAPSLGWSFNVGAATATTTSINSNMSLLLTGSVLNMGGINPSNTRQPSGTSNYGSGGIYPDVSANPRSDGLDARVRDYRKAGGVALLFMSRGRGTIGPIPIGGVTGRFRMDVLSIFGPFSGALATPLPERPGEAIIPMSPPAGISPALLGATVYFQAITIDSTFQTLDLTNVAGVSF
jgi:hypothetical protein